MSLWDWFRTVVTDNRYLYAVHGIEHTTPAFQRKLIDIADRHRLDPNYLLAIMSFETAGSFSPSQPNLAGSGAVGLIQFMPTSAKFVGATVKSLSAMSALVQLNYVERYFEGVIKAYGPLNTLEEHYTAVLAGRPYRADEALRFSVAQYAGNMVLDADRDGKITAREATAPVQRILNAGRSRPRIIVPR